MMLNALMIAILSLLIGVHGQPTPASEPVSVKPIETTVNAEPNPAAQEVKPMTKPAIDQTAIDKLEAKINSAKISIAVTERHMELVGPERAKAELPTLERKKANLADLERQLAELQAQQ